MERRCYDRSSRSCQVKIIPIIIYLSIIFSFSSIFFFQIYNYLYSIDICDDIAYYLLILSDF